MVLTNTITEVLTRAEAKALATAGPAGINVVPVSMVRVADDAIWLFDFFMDKTSANLMAGEPVALTAWTDMTGVQIKGTVEYLTAGEKFNEAVAWCRTQNPDRVVKALIVISPTEVFDISPGGAFTFEELEPTT